MAIITKHSTRRIIERNDGINSIRDAKKLAKQAKVSGKTINAFQEYPKFHSYLCNKKSQTRTCSIRVYKGNIYIWRGENKTLVTAHPIPDRFKEELNGGIKI